MAISFVRTLILYVLVVAALRIMGKRQVGELQPGELVVAIMISDLGTIPLADTALPLAGGIIPILTLIGAELLLSILSLKSEKIRRIFSGTPSVIIRNGELCRKEMKKNRYSLEDLAESLRMKDIYNIDDVHTAILETNGSLSVIPKSDKRGLKAEDFNLPYEQETLPFVLIADGKVYKKHLKEAGVDENWLKKTLKSHKISSPEEVFLLTADSDKKIVVQLKNNK